jgi:hypothetical protein
MGIRLAVVISQLSDDSGGTSKMSMGFGGGAFFSLGLSPKLAVQPELWYLPKGGKLTNTTSYYDTYDILIDEVLDYKLNLTYVEVPLLVKYYFDADRKQAFFAGPAFGFLMGAKAKGTYSIYEDGSLTSSVPIDVDMKADFKSSALSLVLGSTRSFGKLQVEARYSLGFSNIWKGTDGTMKDSLIIGSLGYSF